MAEEPQSYQCMRSRTDVHSFIVCYADHFYADVPYHVRRKGLYTGTGRGDVAKLKHDLRLALARDRYVVLNCPEAVLMPEAYSGPVGGALANTGADGMMKGDLRITSVARRRSAAGCLI